MAFGTFFYPGPTEVRPEVLAAMAQPVIPHRGKEFEELFGRIMERLRPVFRTRRPVYVSTSSATGMMEAAVRCAPAGLVLSLVHGAFSERFAAIARACDRDTTVIEFPPGRAVDPEVVRAELVKRQYAAITVVHSETSTGAQSQIPPIASVAQEHGARILVDSVTGVGGARLEMDEWWLDFALTGSQKALALPPGLAFAVASDRFATDAQRTPGRGLYFDIVEFEKFAKKRQTPNTPAVSLLYAADAQLAAIEAEGMEERWSRHSAMAKRTWEWAASLGLEIVAPEGERAMTVSAIRVPDGITPAALVTAVKERGYVIGGGYGALKETTFRIGHMGDHTLEGLEGCLSAIEDALTATRDER